MARPHSRLSLLFLRLLLLLRAATAASYSSLCHSPAFAADVPDPKHSLGGAPLLALPSISTGHFSGGGDLEFAPAGRYDARAFFFNPRESSASATTEPAVTHLSATLTLEGARLTGRYNGGNRPHSVSFDLDGYYSTVTGELCMVGTGSYAREDGFGVHLLSDVVLRLSVPRPSNLTTAFVTGRLGGADFNQITLIAYAEDDYEYGEVASCPPTPGTRPVLRAGFSCGRLRRLLGRSSYSLEYRPGSGNAASGSPLRLRHGSMYINQLRCGAADGAVRAYIVFYADQPAASPSNYTARRWRREHGGFLVGDEALVADGFWDSSRSRLCLRACRVASSSKSSADLAVGECGIGVSFWFPAVWSVRDRSAAKGMIWNASGNSDGGDAAGVISASRTGGYLGDGDLSGIKYKYTRVEEAKKHYDTMPALSKERKGRFPGNYSYRDFAFRFSLKKQGLTRGYASPVTIGSALVEGDVLVADAAFGAEEVNKQRLLQVSYTLRLRYGHVAYMNSSANSSRPMRRISAEGVYDTKTGSLCMVACQVTNGSSDCEVLVTVQFAPMDDATAREHAVGTISSLRKKSDPLFFESLDLVGGGMYVEQVEESSSRMDTESVMLVVSMALSCAFTALQLRHVRNHPEALPATSLTMLVVLALGYAIPLVLNLEDTYGLADDSRRRYFVKVTSGGLLELNAFVLRATTMLALALQLRLLQLAVSRQSADRAGGKQHGDSSSSSPPPPSSSEAETETERSTLWVCLPLYALGAVAVWIAHMSESDTLPGPRQALADDLAAYAGLVLDGFLLPQVVWNALSGSGARRALSPWFYAGVAGIRAAPHAYDAFRKRRYVPSWRPSYVYASTRDDLFGVGWDVAVPCGAALLVVLLFLQQRRGESGRRGEYEMVSTPVA